MPLKHCVVFDLGKVMVDFDYSIAIKKLAESSEISERDLATLIGEVDLMIQYETGLITSETFFNSIKDQTGYKGTIEDFKPVFGNIFKEIPEMTAFQARLIQNGVRTAAFSNTNEMSIEFIAKAFPFYGRFHHHLLSYEKKRMKPDPVFYEFLEEETGMQGNQIIYLDDRPENIDQGLKMGWQAHVHTEPVSSIRFVMERMDGTV